MLLTDCVALGCLIWVQKSIKKVADDDVWVQIKVAGADVTAPLAFLLLMGGVYYGWDRSNAAAARQKRGRWVYDRSLGGKKVRSCAGSSR